MSYSLDIPQLNIQKITLKLQGRQSCIKPRDANQVLIAQRAIFLQQYLHIHAHL